MPIIRNYQYKDMPAWAELKRYERMYLLPGKVLELEEKEYPKAAVFCLSGSITVREGDTQVTLTLGQAYEFKGHKVSITAQPYYFCEKASFMYMSGTWVTASFNMFHAEIFENPKNEGTPCDYYRNCSFDNHYHDFDEYWILWEGHGVAWTEGKPYEVGPGDCVATGIGWHHDFPIAHDHVLAVTVETEGTGLNREGHLWEQVHGKAVPHLDRV